MYCNTEMLFGLFLLCINFSTSVFGLGETCVWEPKLNTSHNLMDQKWTVLKDRYGKHHFVLLQPPTWMNSMVQQSEKLVKPENKDEDKSDKKEDLNVRFYLYTKKNNVIPQEIFLGNKNNLHDSNFDLNKSIKILIHGYLGSYQIPSFQTMKSRFLELEDSNIIIIDWSTEAGNYYYPTSAENTKAVGEYVGNFLNFLMDQGASLKNIHLIGHSLGAHVAGFAGSSVRQGQILRITGLDPALPNFFEDRPKERLNTDNAEFVDCIHTCGGTLGFHKPICSADFYPNGGVVQPGCSWYQLADCSHSRAHEFYSESIIPGHKFTSFSCPSLAFDETVKCKNEGAVMGYPASKKFSGIFYLETNGEFPFYKNFSLPKNI